MFDRFPKAEPNGLLAATFLAFLATAGLFYVNIMPTIVNGLIEALGFSDQQAGYVASANMYGAALGALVIIGLVKRFRWQNASVLFLFGLIAMDLLSLLVQSPSVLIPMRFGHGFIGGMLVGTAFSVIARTAQPDRTFGMLLFVQFGLGGLGVMLIPGLVPQFGTSILFFSLIAFSTVTLLMLPFLAAYPIVQSESSVAAEENGASRLPLYLTLACIFLFQAANMGLYAYIIELGGKYGLELTFMSWTLGVAAWMGLAGAGLVILVSDRLGYTRPLVASIVLTAIATAGYFYSNLEWVWIAANFVIGISWAYTMSYLLGLVSRFDSAGQMAALGGFASKMGLASGPALAAALLGRFSYPAVIAAAVIALAIAMLLIVYPARLQDAKNP